MVFPCDRDEFSNIACRQERLHDLPTYRQKAACLQVEKMHQMLQPIDFNAFLPALGLGKTLQLKRCRLLTL